MVQVALLTEDGTEVPTSSRILGILKRPTGYLRKDAPVKWTLDSAAFFADTGLTWANVRWPAKPITHMRFFFPEGPMDARIDSGPHALLPGDTLTLTQIRINVTPH